MDKKKQLIHKNLGKKYLESYLKDLEHFFDRPISENELLDLEGTTKLSRVSFDNSLLTERKYNSEKELYSNLREILGERNGYVFIKNSNNCGALKTKGIEFIVNSANVKKLSEEIIVFISQEAGYKFLLEYYEGLYELEIYERH